VPDIPGKGPKTLDETRPVWLARTGGYRAGIIASLLAAANFDPVVFAGEGVTEVLAAMSNGGS
jgi:hypothetical protein